MSAPFGDARAIFFDVDDTLYDFKRSMRHAFEHLHGAFPDLFAQHKVDEIEAAYWRHYHAVPEERKVELINTDPDRFRRVMWAGALADLGLQGELDPLAVAMTDEMQRMRPQHWRMSMYEGAEDLLHALKARYTLGAITNGPGPVQRPKLEALRYRDYFPERLVFVSGEFGARKPDAAIFLAAAKAAGAEPSECLMVGDAREFDMPAKAVGFRTILFTGPREVPDVSKDEWRPDAVAASYADLRRLILAD